MSNLRNTILTANDIESKPVEVPQWGVTVEARGLTGAERAALLAKTVDGKGKFKGFAHLEPDMVIAGAYDPETGERIFTSADRKALSDKSAGALEKIASVVMGLSGLSTDDEADKDAEGN